MTLLLILVFLLLFFGGGAHYYDGGRYRSHGYGLVIALLAIMLVLALTGHLGRL